MTRIWIAAVLLMAAACNPNRRIIMENRTKGPVEFRWQLAESDTVHLSPFFLSNSHQVNITLRPQSPYNEARFSFGLGSWPADTLRMILSQVERLQITSPKGTILLKTPETIYTFLASRRRGLGRRDIRITIRE
jgi:hypothetical protein